MDTTGSSDPTIQALADISEIGASFSGWCVAVPDLPAHYAEQLHELRARGLIECWGRVFRLSRAGREALSAARPELAPALALMPPTNQDAPPPPAPEQSKRAGKFVCERNPEWLGHVHEFRRIHGRQPTAQELMARFPDMSRASAYNYRKLGGPVLRLISKASAA